MGDIRSEYIRASRGPKRLPTDNTVPKGQESIPAGRFTFPRHLRRRKAANPLARNAFKALVVATGVVPECVHCSHGAVVSEEPVPVLIDEHDGLGLADLMK